MSNAPAVHVFGETLRRAREAKGLSTRDLATATGLDHSMIVKIEGGTKRPGNDTLAKIGDVLGVRLVEHMGSGIADPPAAAAPAGPPSRIPWRELHVWGGNVRTVFSDDAALFELCDSIAARGVLQPLLVRPSQSGAYEIIAGQRRWEAVRKLAGMGRIADDYAMPVIVHEADDKTATLMSLAENLVRADMNPMDEAAALLELAEGGATTAEVAAAIGRTPRFVQMRIQVAQRLCEPAASALRDERITLAQAEALCTAELDADQHAALARILEGALKTEAQVRDHLFGLKGKRQAEKERDAHNQFKNSPRPAALDIPERFRRDKPAPPPAAPAQQMDLEDVAGVKPAGRPAEPAPEPQPVRTPSESWRLMWTNRLAGWCDRLEALNDLRGPPVSLVVTDIQTGMKIKYVYAGEVEA